MNGDELHEKIAALVAKQDMLAEQQIKLMEQLEKAPSAQRPAKDRWDRLSAIAPIISATIIALGGAWFTAIYNKQQLKLQEIQTIEKFFPHLTGNEKSKRAAILAISSLTDAKLAANVAAIYASEGTVSALEQIAKSGEHSERRIVSGALVRALDTMAESYQLEKRYEEAIKTCERALVLREEAYGPLSPKVLPSLNRLIELHIAHRDFAEAEGLLQRVINIKKATFGSESTEVAAELRRLSELYLSQGDKVKYRAAAATAGAIEEKFQNSVFSAAESTEESGEDSVASAGAEAVRPSLERKNSGIPVDSEADRSAAELKEPIEAKPLESSQEGRSNESRSKTIRM